MTDTTSAGEVDKTPSPTPAEDWWHHAVVYQIYPRSFADSNGDGLGDLPGVIAHLDYLQNLGIDAIWLSPFYPSPLNDGGYDVSDYMNVDPRLGTLDDFRRLVLEAHARGLKIMVDVVPNHTSSEHPWFIEALAAEPGSAARDRYIFRDSPDGDPPTDWRSHFGGSAWQQIPDGQWYCHLFDRTQPDLNWSNPAIREYFRDVLRFWGDLGVDGFRVDVAHALEKDLTEPLRSQPNLDSVLPLDGTDPLYDRDGVHEIYRGWRDVFNEYDPPLMAVAETWTPASSRTALYARRDELGQVFDFSLLKANWALAEYRETITASLERHDELNGDSGGATWVLSSHDVPRHASRLALPPGVSADDWLLSNGTVPVIDSGQGLRRAQAATLLMLALPGSAYLYQGEELGLREVFEIPAAALTDPVWQRSNGTLKGRDGCRVPLPWVSTEPGYGFGSADPWLPQPDEWAELSVDQQEKHPGSTLHFYRRALQLRRELFSPTMAFAWADAPTNTLAFTRGDHFICMVNFGSTSVPLPRHSRVIMATTPIRHEQLAPESAVWLKPGALRL